MLLKNDFLEVEVDGITFISSTLLSRKDPATPSKEVRGGVGATNINVHTGKPYYILDQDALSGWLDGVSTKRTSIPRPNAWGDFSEPANLNSRLITMTGTAVASSVTELHQMRDDFMGILNSGQYKEIAVKNASGERYSTVGLEGTPQWVQQWDTVAAWKINFYAPDPRVYGPVQQLQIGDSSVSGGLDYPISYPLNYGAVPILQQIANTGNTDAWPTFIVTGNFFSGFSIHDDRRNTVTYSGQVSMMTPVIIDMGRGYATQNGQDRSTFLTRRQWFSIPKNDVLKPRFEPIQDGPGWCDIIYRSTYI